MRPSHFVSGGGGEEYVTLCRRCRQEGHCTNKHSTRARMRDTLLQAKWSNPRVDTVDTRGTDTPQELDFFVERFLNAPWLVVCIIPSTVST